MHFNVGIDAPPSTPSKWPRDLGSWHGYIFGLHTILDSQSINPSSISTFKSNKKDEDVAFTTSSIIAAFL